MKTVCQTGLPEDASQQKKRYTTHRGPSQRPSRGCISHSLRVQGPNTPSGGPLRRHTTGGVPFSLLACILWETSPAHCFHRKSPKLPKSAQNRGTLVFDLFFRKVSPPQTMLSPIFEKKVRKSPRWTILRGWGFPHFFFRNSPIAWFGCPKPLQNRVFFGGGVYNPL